MMLIFIGIILNNQQDFFIMLGSGKIHRFGVRNILNLALPIPTM
jgi:hypothetical protein